MSLQRRHSLSAIGRHLRATRFALPRFAWLLAACLGLLYFSARPAAAQDCDSCIDGIRVGVQAALLTSTPADYSSISVFGGDRHLFISGPVTSPACESTILTNKGYIKMKLDQTYIVQSSRFLCLAHVNFDVPPGYELYIKTDPIYGNDPVYGPEEFHPGTTIYRTNQGYTGTGDGAWEIVLREKCFKCGVGGGGRPGVRQGMKFRTLSDGSMGLMWGVGLGDLPDGRSAESITIRKEVWTDVYSPKSLIYTPPVMKGLDVIYTDNDGVPQDGVSGWAMDPSWSNPYGILRQVKVPETFVDIVTISPAEYEMRFYDPANVGAKVNGLYTVSGQPFSVWNIKNPVGSGAQAAPAGAGFAAGERVGAAGAAQGGPDQRLQISETQNGTTYTSEYAWDPAAQAWTLTDGGGTETRSSVTDPADPSLRTETIIRKEAGGQVSSKQTLTYRYFPWGEEVIQEVSDPDAAALTTTYAFYEDATQTARYSKPASVTRPDGSWERYDYDAYGNRQSVMRPWLDSTLANAESYDGHVTEYTYTNNDGMQTEMFARQLESVKEYAGGYQIRKTNYARASAVINGQPAVIESKTEYPKGGNPSFAGGLTTRTARYYRNAIPLYANRTAWTESPDGRRDTFQYERGTYTPNADPSLSQFTPSSNGAAERATVVHGTVGAHDGVAFKTTKETTVRDAAGHSVLQESYAYNGSGYERVGWTASLYDGRGLLLQTTRHDGTVLSAIWSGSLKQSEQDESGVETVYTYDALQRLKTQTRKGVAAAGGFPAQPDIVTTYTYDADGRALSQVLAAGSLSLTTSNTYDKSGRVLSSTNATGLTTTYAYTNGGRTTTATLPGGATKVTDRFLDGRTRSITGTAVVASYFDYGVNPDSTPYTQEFAGSGGLGSPRWKKSSTDWLGRLIKVERPTTITSSDSFPSTVLLKTYEYNSAGKLGRERETFGVGAAKLTADWLYEYDELGQQVREGLDINDNGVLDLASTDRLAETFRTYEKSGSDWFKVATLKRYEKDGDSLPTTRSLRTRLTSFPAGGAEKTVSETIDVDEDGNQTKTTSLVDRAAKKVTSVTDTPDSAQNAVVVAVNGLAQSAVPSAPQSATTFTYDALGRRTGVNDPRTGTSVAAYQTTTGQLTSFSASGRTATYEYYPATHPNAGRLKAQVDSAGKKVYFAYSPRGEVVQTWGDTVSPGEYVFDGYGQMTELHTFRAGSGWQAAAWPSATTGAADITRWVYDETTGLLTDKQDAAGKGATYTYDILGRPLTRKWARTGAGGNRLSTTYAYDAKTGDLSVIAYSDGTPQVRLAYTRGGRPSSIVDAAGTHTLNFNTLGRLQDDQIAGGPLAGVKTSFGYDGFQRRGSVQATFNSTTLINQTYGYDSWSRLGTVTSGAQTVTYAYDSARGLPNSTAFTGGTQVSRTFDAQGRLNSITTTPASDAAQSYTYTYNGLGQRTRVTREDASYWSYGYNDRGELTGGKKYWSDNTPAAGQQQEYVYDPAGNRTSTMAGGDAAGAGLRQALYAANSLNQYQQRGVPGAADIIGSAAATATVTVNGGATYRRGSYFEKTLTFDNTAGPVYAQVDVVGAKAGVGAGGEDAVTTQSGNVFVPKSVEGYTYDLDGNTTSDGRWTYTWDGENRLSSMTALPSVPNGAKRRLEFVYDWMSRRVQKKVYGWNAQLATYQLQATTKFIYDGWNLIAELDGANSLVRSYVWGADLSGALQGAGGVGGLLLIGEGGNTYQAGFDGNGNVAVLVKAGAGTIAAAYDYDPFGNVLRAEGAYAAANPFRFSTKYVDRETGLSYYGYRFYGAQAGRWLNRDPSGESAGANLYAFVSNSPAGNVDALGLYEKSVHYYLTFFLASNNKCLEDKAEEIANADQGTDEDDKTMPGAGWHSKWYDPTALVAPAGAIFRGDEDLRQQEVNAFYHALKPGAAEGFGNPALWAQATRGNGDTKALGQYLHYLQDTYSHAGFYSPKIGHGLEHGNLPDHTITDPAKTIRMARATWKALNDYASRDCKCWDEWRPEWDQRIMEFAEVGDPSALARVLSEESDVDVEIKRRLLDVPVRKNEGLGFTGVVKGYLAKVVTQFLP